MAREDIAHGMQVLGSDGAVLGLVDGVEDTAIKLQRGDSADGIHHFVPLDSVDRVDEHVHLNVTSTAARAGWVPAAGAGTTGAASHHAAEGARKGMSWLPWVIGALLLLGLILLLRGCDDDDAAQVADPNAADTSMAGTTAPVAGAGATDENGQLMTRDVETYLAGTEATPRTFGFNNVFFDTGSSTIRPDDQQEVAALAKVLATRPGLKADIVGMADAQGNDTANTKLAMDRARAVMKLLVANGVSAGGLTVSSAGEGNSAGADQGARRVDLVINAR